MIRFLLFLCFIMGVPGLFAQKLPDGFYLEEVTSQINYPVGIAHTGTEDSYVWTQDGMVWLVTEGELNDQPVLDISEEVGFWSDHGMLGLALHPDFKNNGWIYLMYVVDRHHLNHAGTPRYDNKINDYNNATIGRITRYTVDPSDRSQIMKDSRKVIVGQTPQDGIPITTTSHGIGTLLFGRDTSLLFSVGDGSAPGKDFVGQPPFPNLAFDQQALKDGIITEAENIGAYRSQYLNTYCGKILRINPDTGAGLASNPFYDSDRADEPISKVWALGFRNPFRMTRYPDIAAAGPRSGPGNILVGDVGDWSWEEINIVDGPGLNYGWPVYQGIESYYLFRDKKVPNYEANIPENRCGQTHFYFKDLIVQSRKDHSAKFVHPCGPGVAIPDSVPLFVHQRPALSYVNWISDTVTTQTPGYTESGESRAVGIHDPSSTIEHGVDFSGSSTIAGVFYTLDGYPDTMKNAYFHGDFQGWLRVLNFDNDHQVTAIEEWSNDIGGVVHISENPYDENIYIVTHDPHRIQRLRFEGNRKPVIVSTPDTIYGPAPLTVTFDASGSYDPEGDSLSFLWDFGGRDSSTKAVTEHTFVSDEPQSFEVQLAVSDQFGATTRKKIFVSVNNTPPKVNITSISVGDQYSLRQPTEWPLEAEVSDEEHGQESLTYDWRVFLHHNTHFHQEAQYDTRSGVALIEPLGCGIETYYYRIQLSVEDPLGLRTTQEKLIHPNCDEIEPEFRTYPNPAGRYLILEAGAKQSDQVNVFIHDLNGRLQFKSEADIREGEKVRLDLPILPPGFYIMQMVGKNFRIHRKVALGF
ncbi:PQQ-dependent sugar dehydrogenase [Membranicola marinus]|uniref:PQQ-dependent sugar dehydrogenase n=1 Tax=Membranihabitans marinus TaxID=1227546 RepID=A0A953L8G8_9BACT|nr:PQQ-dependent sugar dehydrogenase [Membranihabitans marinus]MBY5956533.1 PQQ-dependent sugar dehydrogenase [Membranihabitans marinus]